MVFILSGRIEGPVISELRELIARHADNRPFALDLKDVRVVDREVMRFMAGSEADGVRLENCPAYVREWMEREKD
jgi:predicted metal-binding protein